MIFQPRIWRSPKSKFLGDEVLQSAEVYTRETLRGIREEGFDGIWLRGSLYDLMDSHVLPGLNRPRAEERRQLLRELIARGQQEGVGVWLFFNEPKAIPFDDSFWLEHPELKGEPHDEFWRQKDGDFLALGDMHSIPKKSMVSLCVSHPLGREFFVEAVNGLLSQIPGLAGVILITASEAHAHCWSHYTMLPTGDAFRPVNEEELSCPRCRERGPAAVVLDIISIWQEAVTKMPAPCRVFAWNWSWSMWYPDPQHEIVDHLPEGVGLQLDCERGGFKTWQGRTIPIDEYSIGYVGPSERFRETRRAAGARPVNAKLQINTTHEIASVPNLPLIPNLFEKWSGLHREGTAGVMGSWNFAVDATLNTHAFRRFNEQEWDDESAFCRAVAASYFGDDVNTDAVLQAWKGFCEAFVPYPFNFGVLYFGLVNYAPANPLDLTYHARQMGMSHLYQKQWGDRLEDTYEEWALEDVLSAWQQVAKLWQQALPHYRKALTAPTADPLLQRHRRDELSCAEMIGRHLISTYNAYRFHAWRLATMRKNGLTAPCTLEADDEARAIWQDELANVRQTIPLMEADPRLAYHGEAYAHLFDIKTLQSKIAALTKSLES